MKEGITTPASRPRGYPDMGDVFSPGAERKIENAEKLASYYRQTGAQPGAPMERENRRESRREERREERREREKY